MLLAASGFEGKAGRARLQQTQHCQVKDPSQTFCLSEHFIQVQKYENKTQFSSSSSVSFLCISLWLNGKTGFSVSELFIIKLISLLGLRQWYKVSVPRLQNVYCTGTL